MAQSLAAAWMKRRLGDLKTPGSGRLARCVTRLAGHSLVAFCTAGLSFAEVFREARKTAGEAPALPGTLVLPMPAV